MEEFTIKGLAKINNERNPPATDVAETDPNSSQETADNQAGETPETTYEAKTGQNLLNLELKARDEKRRGEFAFSLEQFARMGGQQLVDLFGVENVSDALDSFTIDLKRAREPSLLDLVRKLEPDKTKRSEIYQTITKQAEDAATAFQPWTRTASQNYSDAAPSPGFAHSIKMHMEACRTLDSVLGSLGNIGGKILDTLPIGFRIKAEHQGGIGFLKDTLEQDGTAKTLDVAISELRGDIATDERGRVSEAIRMLTELNECIQRQEEMIDTAAWETIRPSVENIGKLMKDSAGSELEENISLSVAESMMKELAQLRQLTNKQKNTATAELHALKQRAEMVARPYHAIP